MSHSNNLISILVIAIALIASEFCEAHKAHMDDICTQPPPSNTNPTDCCVVPELVDANTIEKCGNRVYGLDEMIRASSNEPAFAPHFRCVAECIMNSTRVLQDRKFVPSVALDMAKNQLGAKSVWIPVIQKAVDVCNEHITKTKFSDQKGCSHVGAFVVSCFNAFLFRNCPESLWNNGGSGCANLRETTKNCPLVPVIH